MRRVELRREQVFRGDVLLVNERHPLQGETPLRLAAPAAAFPGIRMENRAAALLAACVAAAGGAGQIRPVSGWRSRAQQQKLWDDSLAENGEAFTRSYVARPGCSEHETGLAIDLGKAGGALDFIRPAFPYDGVCGAFRRLAAGYGFIERYQKGKEGLTGIAAEPWHFRYVGAPHALLLRQNGLCLEEYADFLRTGAKGCKLPGGRAARVFYIPCQGEITRAELRDGCCQLSGDNRDGFIATVWGE